MVFGLFRLLRTSMESFLTSFDSQCCSSDKVYRGAPQWIPGLLMVGCGTAEYSVFMARTRPHHLIIPPISVYLYPGHISLTIPVSLPSFPFAPCSSCFKPDLSRSCTCCFMYHELSMSYIGQLQALLPPRIAHFFFM